MKNPPAPIKRNDEFIPFKNDRNYQSIPQNDRSDISENQGSPDQIQKGFIKKVYSILTLQLLVVVGAVFITMTDRRVARFLRQNKPYFWAALILSIVLLLVLTCITKIARKFPINFILLFIFTGCEAYMVSYSCAATKPKLVFMAASMTAAMVLMLTLYACVTDTDYTTFGAILFAFAMALLLGGIFYMITKNKVLYIILCVLGVFLSSIYIIYDTQLILRNKSHSLSVDDYIIAPMFLFVDIVGLFLNLLGIVTYFDE